ncbi:MAG: Ig-like domain-containing protein [Acidobacteria bacterium]|nr:Ig-like domain-containing protein [Acidobacteriota bacterium]
MRHSQYLLRGALCLAMFAGVVSAQSIAALSGSQGTSTSVQIYTANPSLSTPISLQTTISGVPAGAFQILATPNGLKYYILSPQGVTLFSSSSRVPVQIATAIQGAPSKAWLTPDGGKLVVLAGSSATTQSVYVIDATTDALLNPYPLSISGAMDIAMGIDSQNMYVLTKGTSAASVIPVTLTPTLTAGTAINIATTGATGIIMAPNGLLYVSGTNSVFEISPVTLQVTAGASAASPATIPVNGTPGPLAPTYDGNYAFAVNTNGSGAVYFVFNLNDRTVNLSQSANLGGAVLDKVFVGGNSNRAFFYSSQNKMLYEGNTAGGFNETPLKDQIRNGTVGSTVTSYEVPAKTLYLTSQNASSVNTIYQFDLSTNQMISSLAMPGDQTLLAWTGLNPTSGAALLTSFNPTQTVAAGAVSKPMVVRVLDSAGRPVYGATVTFAALSGGVTLSATNVSSNSQGLAAITATAGSTGGSYQIQASLSGASPTNFTITVPGGGTGTCTQNCNATPTNLTILKGNGQVVSENNLSAELLLVSVKDASGNPVANQMVTWAISSTTVSGITLLCTSPAEQSNYPNTTIPNPTTACVPDQNLTNVLITYTDAKGLAAIKFSGQSLYGTGASFVTTGVSATTVLGASQLTVNFTETTVVFSQGATFNAVFTAPEADSRGQRLITGNAGSTIAGAIQADVYSILGVSSGMPLPGVALNVSGPATCANGSPLSDANGHVSCNLVMGSTVTTGPTALTVDVGSFIQVTNPILVTINPGTPPTVKATQGNGGSGKAGTQFALRAQVTNASGTAAAGAATAWTVVSGSATLTNVTTQADSQGYTTATATLGATVGTVVIKVTAGSGTLTSSANFTLTVLPTVTVGAVTIVSGNGQTTTASTAFGAPLVVKVTDGSGQPLSGLQVTFSATGATATLGSPAVTTDSSGQASTAVTAGASAGTVIVTASTNGVQTQFTLTIAPPGPSIDTTSFRNAASGLQGLTPCGIATVTGTGIATGINGTVMANSFLGPLPYTLVNDSVTVNGVPAPIFWVSNTTSGGEAIAFQTPCEISVGAATVTVGYNGGSKTVSGVTVSALQPGIFETLINNKRYAVMLHVSDGSYVTPDNPARRGESLKLFVTGLGAVTPATSTNRVGLGGQKPTAIITAGLNNGGVPVTGAEYLPGAIGIYTVTFTVPTDTATGDYQNVGLIVSDPANPSVAIYANGSFVKII